MTATVLALGAGEAGAATPERVWGTYVGGGGSELDSAVAIDEAGYIYLAGETSSVDGIATPGAYQTVNAGSFDAYVMKFDPGGKRVWGTYFGGPGNEAAYTIAARGGKVAIGGWVMSTSGIATPGAFDTEIDNVADGFVACFTDAGALLWGTYVGGALGVHAQDLVFEVAIEAQGDVYAAGRASDGAGIGSAGTHQPGFGGGSTDGYLLRLGDQGQRVWGTYYGGSAAESVWGMALAPSGTVYIGGASSSTTKIASPGAFQVVNAGSADGFVARFDESGTRAWGTYFGGAEVEATGRVAAHPDGGVVFATYGLSTGLATPGVHQEVAPGAESTVVARFDADGKRLWSTYVGGESSDHPEAVVVGAGGAIYVGGGTSSTGGIATPDAYQPVLNDPNQNVFVTRLDDAGQRVWGTYYGGTGQLTRGGRLAWIAGGLVVTGHTGAPNGMATPGAHKEVPEGADHFLARFTDGDGGAACAGNDECDSGHCVDGVCCDGACGGGDPDDCQACSVAAGAAFDGFCGPRAPGECRPAAGDCDVAEACDGVSLACPSDQVASDGTTCGEGSVCEAGTCVGASTSEAETSSGGVDETAGPTSGATTTDGSGTGGATGEAPTSGTGSPDSDGAGSSGTGESAGTIGEDAGTTAGTTGGAQTGGPASDSGGGEAPGADAGCGCRGAPPSALAVAVVVLALSRRRRR